MQKPYDELVAQATRAVSGVKDAELRRVAFERVLEDLLTNASGRSTAPARRLRRSRTEAMSPSRRLQSKRGGPLTYVEEMVDEKFFAKPKTIAEVKSELESRGHHIPITSLSGPLQKLCQKKRLRRQKAKGEGKKLTFSYSNW